MYISNSYFDTTATKAGISGYSEYIEYANLIEKQPGQKVRFECSVARRC